MYLFVFFLVFVVNVIPAFMPPTWIVLSFFYLQFHLSLVPAVIIGACAATLGRIVLALIAHRLENFLPKSFLGNYKDLGEFLKKNESLTVPVVIGYAFSPVSSNTLFIIAGLSGLNLKVVAASFFVGRLISYSFWIAASHALSSRLDQIFLGHFSNAGTIASAIISVFIVFIVGQIKWGRVLLRK